MSETPALSLDDLMRAVDGDAAVIRRVRRLQPAGGPGDKILPKIVTRGSR